MTLILNNNEIESVFTLDECFDVLEPALRDLGNGKAINISRQDLLVPGPLDGSYHGLKTSCASLPRLAVTTMRLTSDILTWPIVGGRQRRRFQEKGRCVRSLRASRTYFMSREPGESCRRIFVTLTGGAHPRLEKAHRFLQS
jgi:hypothetical protein